MAAEEMLPKAKYEVLEIKEVIEPKFTSEPSAVLVMSFAEYEQNCHETGVAVRYSEEAWIAMQMKAKA